MTEIVNFAYLK